MLAPSTTEPRAAAPITPRVTGPIRQVVCGPGGMPEIAPEARDLLDRINRAKQPPPPDGLVLNLTRLLFLGVFGLSYFGSVILGLPATPVDGLFSARAAISVLQNGSGLTLLFVRLLPLAMLGTLWFCTGLHSYKPRPGGSGLLLGAAMFPAFDLFVLTGWRLGLDAGTSWRWRFLQSWFCGFISDPFRRSERRKISVYEKYGEAGGCCTSGRSHRRQERGSAIGARNRSSSFEDGGSRLAPWCSFTAPEGSKVPRRLREPRQKSTA